MRFLYHLFYVYFLKRPIKRDLRVSWERGESGCAGKWAPRWSSRTVPELLTVFSDVLQPPLQPLPLPIAHLPF